MQRLILGIFGASENENENHAPKIKSVNSRRFFPSFTPAADMEMTS